MAFSGYFSVQRARSDGSFVEADCVFTQAVSAIAAAEQVLGEGLTAHGKAKQTRARVWYLSDDFSPISVTFYRPLPTPTADIKPCSKGVLLRRLAKRSRGSGEHIERSYDYGVLSVIAVCCLPVVIVAALVVVFAN